MDDIKNIIAKIKAGKLVRGNDEKYALGFWDYAWRVAGRYNDERQGLLSEVAVEELAVEIYSSLWATVEAVTGKNYDN